MDLRLSVERQLVELRLGLCNSVACLTELALVHRINAQGDAIMEGPVAARIPFLHSSLPSDAATTLT